MKKVLLVNDSKFESIVIKDTLSLIGYGVKIIDEYNILKELKNFEPDYAILNLNMREITGDKLASLIKLKNSKIKCILSSSSPININDYSPRIIDNVFQTPIDANKLERIFEEVDENHNTTKLENTSIQN